MGKLTSFTFTSLNGFYQGGRGDTSWHRHNKEAADYSRRSLKSGDILLFGRVTYEMMRNYWPTPPAREAFPEIAAGMKQAEKIVVSSTLQQADWGPTTILYKNWIASLREHKQQHRDRNITLLGSGSLLRQLTAHRLIDEYQIMIDPVVLAAGQALFAQLPRDVPLELIDHAVFPNGTLLLRYRPQS